MRLLYAVLIVLALAGAAAGADEFPNEAYLLRFGATLRRATGFASAAALQATAAHPAGWSINPAADDVLHDRFDDDTLGATLSNIQTFTQSGAWFTDTSVTTGIRLPERGTLSLAYARSDTIEGDTRQGFNNVLRSNEFFWGYSKSVSEALAVGAQTRFLTSEIDEEGMTSALPVPGRFDTDAVGLDVVLGARWAPNPIWSWGVVGGVGWGWTTTEVTNLVALPNPLPPPPAIPAGTRLSSVDDHTRSYTVRMGAGFSPTSSWGLYADGEYFHVESGFAGNLDAARVLAGVELTPCEHRVVRFGAALDDLREVTLSAGAGTMLWECARIEFAYQHNAFPEVKREYGRFQLLEISAVVRY